MNVWCVFLDRSGGLGSYLLGMNKKAYELTGVDTVGNSPSSYKEPAMGWLTAYLLVVCFIGLFVLIPLRKVYIYIYSLYLICLYLLYYMDYYKIDR